MATESTESMLTSLSSFFPILMGFSSSGSSDPDRILLVNPLTRRMVVAEGESASISDFFGAGGGGEPPASKKSIEALTSVEAGDDVSECPVCLDELRMKKAKEMPCRHRFHGVCIEKWLKMHGSCPVCRYRMPEETVAEENKDREEVADVAGEEEGSSGYNFDSDDGKGEEGGGGGR